MSAASTGQLATRLIHRPLAVIVLCLATSASRAQDAPRDGGATAVEKPAHSGRSNETLLELLRAALHEVRSFDDTLPKRKGEDFPSASESYHLRWKVAALRAIGTALASTGDRDAARAVWDDAVDAAKAIEPASDQALALTEIAADQRGAAEDAAALTVLRQAVETVRTIKDDGRAPLFRESRPEETRAELLATIATLQKTAGDPAAAHHTVLEAREAAEAIESLPRKVQLLAKAAKAEDPTGSGEAWQQTLDLALSSKDEFTVAAAVEVVLREQAKLGAYPRVFQELERSFKGDLQSYAVQVVLAELMRMDRRDRPVPPEVATRLAALVRRLGFDQVAKREMVVRGVAVMLARAGADSPLQILESFQTTTPAQKVRFAETRALALRDVARRQIKQGQFELARKSITGAFSAQLFAETTPDFQAEIAELQAEAGDRDGAGRMAESIALGAPKARAFARLAVVAIRRGDRAEAQRLVGRAQAVVGRIPNDELWFGKLRVGQFEEMLKDRDVKIEEPRDDYDDLTDSFTRLPETLIEIAVAQAHVGDLDGAFKTIATLEGRNAATALRRVAWIQAQAKDFAGAQTTAARLPREPHRFERETAPILESIAASETSAGDGHGALDWARGQTTADAKLVLLKGMAVGISRLATSANAPPTVSR